MERRERKVHFKCNEENIQVEEGVGRSRRRERERERMAYRESGGYRQAAGERKGKAMGPCRIRHTEKVPRGRRGEMER